MDQQTLRLKTYLKIYAPEYVSSCRHPNTGWQCHSARAGGATQGLRVLRSHVPALQRGVPHGRRGARAR